MKDNNNGEDGNDNNRTDVSSTIVPPLPPIVIGNIQWNHLSVSPVLKTGKNAELDYKPNIYPNFPLGSAGYAVTLPIATYVATHKNTLFEYQGEDTCLGIWIQEATGSNAANTNTTSLLRREDVIWIKAAEQPGVWEYRLKKTMKEHSSFVWGPNLFSERQDCFDDKNKELMVIGHDLDVNDIRNCHDHHFHSSNNNETDGEG